MNSKLLNFLDLISLILHKIINHNPNCNISTLDQRNLGEMIFLLSLCWSFGSLKREESKIRFEKSLRENIKEINKIPSGSIFDYYIAYKNGKFVILYIFKSKIYKRYGKIGQIFMNLKSMISMIQNLF